MIFEIKELKTKTSSFVYITQWTKLRLNFTASGKKIAQTYWSNRRKSCVMNDEVSQAKQGLA